MGHHRYGLIMRPQTGLPPLLLEGLLWYIASDMTFSPGGLGGRSWSCSVWNCVTGNAYRIPIHKCWVAGLDRERCWRVSGFILVSRHRSSRALHEFLALSCLLSYFWCVESKPVMLMPVPSGCIRTRSSLGSDCDERGFGCCLPNLSCSVHSRKAPERFHNDR